MTARALRPTAQRVHALQTEAKARENEILGLVRQLAPELLYLLGVGPITAAQILVSWSRTASGPKGPSPPSPESHRSPHPRGRPTGTGSTAAVTGTLTKPCTPSP
jgi:hypothetical protein